MTLAGKWISVSSIGLVIACASKRPHAEQFASSDPPCTRSPSRDTTVFMLREVSDTPQVLSGPPLVYPDQLRREHITGRVLIAAIISPQGMPERNSLGIVQSDNPGFNDASLSFLRHAHFRPGCYGGHAVRVRITFPITFNIKD